MPEVDDLSLFFERDASWTQDVGSYGLWTDEKWGQYRGELTALRSSAYPTSLEVVKIGRQLMSPNIALGARVEKAKRRQCDISVAQKVANSELAHVSSDKDDIVVLQKRHSASDVTVEELTTELSKVKAQLVQLTAENLGLLTNIGTVSAEFDNKRY